MEAQDELESKGLLLPNQQLKPRRYHDADHTSLVAFKNPAGLRPPVQYFEVSLAGRFVPHQRREGDMIHVKLKSSGGVVPVNMAQVTTLQFARAYMRFCSVSPGHQGGFLLEPSAVLA